MKFPSFSSDGRTKNQGNHPVETAESRKSEGTWRTEHQFKHDGTD